VFDVVTEEVPAVAPVVTLLRDPLPSGNARYVIGRPELAVGVRIAAPHDGALVLEDLCVADELPRVEGRRFVGPGVHNERDVVDVHVGERQIVARREADDPAEAAHGLGHEQLRRCGRDVRRRTPIRKGVLHIVPQKRRKIVVERERGSVSRVAFAVGACVAGTEIACGIVRREVVPRDCLDLSQPGTFEAVGRAEHPLVEQGIIAAVRATGRHVANPSMAL
jgi:hypothetical protein